MLGDIVAFSQPTAPSLRCISVEANGNVTLTWIAPLDTGTAFGGYHIFSSPSAGGPFTPIDSVFNYNTLTITLPGTNANNSSLYFYLKTREGCCAIYSASSDTLRSIRMIVTSLSNERVRLNWNRTHIPPLPTTISSFNVSKELSPGVYTQFLTILDTTALDTNYFCNRFINYKVTQGDLSGCVSESSVDGELFRDTRGPAQTLIDTVSVDPITGNVIITWFPDSSSDTQGYVIYQFNGISYDSIGSVTGINSLSFINPLSNSSNLSETYTIAAYDSCKNLGSLAANHQTIFLETNFIKCDAKITFEWTPYENMNSGLKRYEIWISENAGPWTRDGFVPPTILSYEKDLTLSGATYEFVIRAVGNDGQTSSSNKREIIADIFDQPAFLYIRSATVTGQSVKINCHVDPASDAKAYILYGSNSENGFYTFIDSKNYTPDSDITFIDAFAQADKGRRFYKITSRDSCGKEFVTSNIAGTVHLFAEGGNDYKSQLDWSAYTGWQNLPGSYQIFRVIGGTVASTPIATLSGDTLTYNDDVSDFSAGDGNICYVIQAREDSINTFGFSDSAFSNVACAPQAPSVYVPNAFTPGGKNPVFKPFLLFEHPATYSLRIFNRWGQQVFETDIPGTGWNGKYNDKEAASGIYAYTLVFKGLNKKEIQRMGTVVLIR